MKGNAKIISTTLGYEDHGILTCYLNLEQEGTGQGFGGYCLDSPNKKTHEREPSIYAGFFIQRILETLEVENWEDLEGTYIRVDGEEFGDIYGIGHITKNKWFYPKRELNKFMDKEA